MMDQAQVRAAYSSAGGGPPLHRFPIPRPRRSASLASRPPDPVGQPHTRQRRATWPSTAQSGQRGLAGVALGATLALFVGCGGSAGPSPDTAASRASPAATRPTGPAQRYQDPVFDAVTVTRDLGYGAAAGPDNVAVRLTLDLYQPTGDSVSMRPALIWAHGGGFGNGDKADDPAALLARLFARLGYVTASINYRLLAAPAGCDGAGLTATCVRAAFSASDDGRAAVRWLRANAATYRVDVKRIAIGGESAGAIAAAGVGVGADRPGDSGNPGYPSNVDAWVSISGGLPNGLFVDGTDAPGLLFAGTADTLTPYQWSADTAAAMRKASVPVELQTLPGADHVPWDQYHALFERESIAFLYRYLDLAQAAR